MNQLFRSKHIVAAAVVGIIGLSALGIASFSASVECPGPNPNAITPAPVKFNCLRKIQAWRYWNKVREHLGTAIERHEILAERIQSAVGQLRAAGKNVTHAQNELNLAKQMLADARAGYDTAVPLVETIYSYPKADDAAVALRDAFSPVRDKVRGAHELLAGVIGVLQATK